MKPARWTEITAWAIGIVLLSSYATLRVSADRARRDGVQAFQALRHGALAQTSSAHFGGGSVRVDQALWSQTRRQAFGQTRLHEVPDGILRIPGLNLIVPIYSGTSSSELDRGVGHVQGTAALASDGNAAIAGHRDGFFRTLGSIQPGQTLYVETLGDTRAYRVTETRIVSPSDVSVLAPTARPSITLITCYPFYFVGPAPRRFIVRAELIPGRRNAAIERTADLSQPQE
jgi:sortase A